MKFVNREQEMDILLRLYDKGFFQFIPIYGRRRVGKTRLVQEFIRAKPAIYFLADTASETEQLKNLGREVGDYYGDHILMTSGFRDWLQMFRYLAEKSGTQRLIFVVDEFPYLVNANNAISSIFQKGIDEIWKDTSIFLILMGSSIGMMEREVLFAKAPLYGRRTGSLEIREMPFAALNAFFPTLDFESRTALYGVFGAIPAYLEKVNESADILGNIRQAILDRGSFLYSEVDFLLREELREPRNYFVILRAIAQGKRKLSEIMNDTGFDKAYLSRYLDILRTLRLIDKEIPVTEKYPEKSRLGLYRLHDRFFTFWFRYIFPYRGRLEIGQTDFVMNAIEKTFPQYLSGVYEEICRELCLALQKDGMINFETIGRWWSKNEEIDLVALDETDRCLYLGECKWSEKPVGTDIYEDLARKAALIDWRAGRRKERFLLFSKSGFTEQMHERAVKDNVILFTGEKKCNDYGVRSCFLL
ncbi:MAG: ATP-binding protein [Deltaproteobacteria bacterium]|nr:ATP-binding protein [Deltaproteobacteria bacterium]